MRKGSSMEDPKETRKAFAALLALPDDAIDLGHAALLIAREEYPGLDVGRYLLRLDEMAEEIRRRMKRGEGAASQIAHLNRLLFHEMGFRGNREILQRMIENLKWIYQRQRDFRMALRIQQLHLCIAPDRPEEIRERGVIHFRLALFAEAVADFERYLQIAPQAPDAPQIQERLKELRRLVPRMN